MNQSRRPAAPVRKLVAAILGTIAIFVMLFGLGLTSWAIVALGAAMLALAVGLTLVNVVRRGARTWVVGTAHVVSVSEPPASSAYGRAELQIVVAAPGLPTSAVKVRDPRVPVAKWPDAGDTLPVSVDVDDMRRVRILWDDVQTHTEAVMNPAPTYPDPLDDLPPDDILAEPEAPPWRNRDRQWARDDDTDPVGDFGAQGGDLRDNPVVVREASGGGPMVLEGTLVESDATTQPLPRRNPTPAAAGSAVDPGMGSVGVVDDPDTDPGRYPETASRPSPRPRSGHRPSPRPRSATSSVEPDGAPTTTVDTETRRANDPGASRPSDQESPVDSDRESPVDSGRESPVDAAAVPVAFPLGQDAGSSPAHPTVSAPRAADDHADPEIDLELDGDPAAPAGGGAVHETAAAPAGGATVAAEPERLTTGVDTDDRIDELITAYPSARPGPAGAIHGVGITVLVTDLERSAAFYGDVLGFFQIDSGVGSAVLASGDTRLVLRTVHDLSPMTGRLIYLNLEVGDVEAVYAELREKGVTFVHGPRPVNRGDRLELWAASFNDPDGHNIAITQWRAVH